jgi:tetrahydromethanopterin S-methyltransferase subunit G
LEVTREDFDQLSKRVAKLETRVTVAERDIQDINKKLDKIDQNTTWILRLIIGAFIMAIITIVIKGGI